MSRDTVHPALIITLTILTSIIVRRTDLVLLRERAPMLILLRLKVILESYLIATLLKRVSSRSSKKKEMKVLIIQLSKRSHLMKMVIFGNASNQLVSKVAK